MGRSPDALGRHGVDGRTPRGTYAGIGARETPPAVLVQIERLAAELALSGWTLRTGLSPGADQAFYKGALAGGGPVELYLPWPDFQAHMRLTDAERWQARLTDGEQAQPTAGRREQARLRPSAAAHDLAARFHPDWDGSSEKERRLRARDAHIVLGGQLADPVQAVICWTPDGGLDGADPATGGTGQALRIADAYGIAVLNLARPGHLRRAERLAADPG